VGRCEKLLARARRAPAALTFRELCALIECLGFELDRIRGSHRIYKSVMHRRSVVVQPEGKMAKTYQVRDLVRLVEGSEDDG